MVRIHINPDVLRWAIRRGRRDIDELRTSFPRLEVWLQGAIGPTYRQLEDFARATRTPFGYFFLPEPIDEQLPIRDFRTLNGVATEPSADLLDTIYAMQRRQDWLREERRDEGEEALAFVGSATLADDPIAIGREMRRIMGLDDGWAEAVQTWQDAVRELRMRIEAIGVLPIVNGIVGNNTSRRLDVAEFRGFALVDNYAPLIFVNGADAKSAQMFTLAHELAHVWLGNVGQGLSGFPGVFPNDQKVEQFCNVAAAEFLVPEEHLRRIWPEVKNNEHVFSDLARKFKVSPVVAGRRALDLRLVDRDRFFSFYTANQQKELTKTLSTGGDFFRTQHSRIGQGFAIAVMRASLEGRLTMKEAYSLTDLHGGTFEKFGRSLGLAL